MFMLLNGSCCFEIDTLLKIQIWLPETQAHSGGFFSGGMSILNTGLFVSSVVPNTANFPFLFWFLSS